MPQRPIDLTKPSIHARRKWPRGPWAWVGGVLVATLIAVLGAFMVTGCAAFGSQPEGERLARAQQSPEWHDGHFENPQPQWRDAGAAWLQLIAGPATPDTTPAEPVPVVHDDARTFARPPASGLRATWFGHSSALIEIDGSSVLIDPFWSERPSPFAWAGPKRWYPPPVSLADLPQPDAVVISHDHYDHLDRATIVAMASGRTVFVVPLGVGAHLSRWGIPEQRIIELDWWQSAKVGTLTVVATPARHASGRIALGSNKTLWAGYALIGPAHRAWYSGDTGFHDTLGQIGERLGPFDVTLIEAGQYDANWPDAHLGPELAVEAHRLVRGKVLLPVHWALIKLARHPWTEPVERVLAAAACRGVAVMTPRPGESIEPTQANVTTRWWPTLAWQSARQRPIVGTKNGVADERVPMAPCGADGKPLN